MRDNGLTISPVHLLISVLEATYERNLGNRLSASAIVGLGKYMGVSVFELGGQVGYQLVGDFDDCIKVGGEVVYVGGSAESGGVSASAGGLAIGPFLGAKTAADFGLTFELDVGWDFFAMQGQSSSGASASARSSGPLLNIQTGWSF